MIETPARITRVDGDGAWVTSAAPSSCGACGGKGCGSSIFARLWHPREPEYRVDNPIGASPGEAVVVGVPDGALLGAVLAGYVTPLLVLLLGAGIGQAFFGEPGAILGGLSGLLLAAAWLRRRRRPGATPVVLRRDDTLPGQACASRRGG
ncbi:MAG: SoxR reducing system RseC family protein [Pseudomonadota bacterium]